MSPRFRCALVSLVLAIGVASPAVAAPGQLVPTFGDGGITTQPIGDGGAEASGVALAPDGNLVTGINLVLPDASEKFGAARFTAAGQLDTATFNSPQGANYGGTAVEANEAFAVGVDSQGRAVMAARTSSDAITVTRYTTAGLPDTSAFASPNGKLRVTIPVPGQFFAVPLGLAIAPDNSIVVVGQAVGVDPQGFVAYITPAGALDPTFNGGAVKV